MRYLRQTGAAPITSCAYSPYCFSYLIAARTPAMVRARGSRRSTSTFSSTPSSWYPQSSLALVPSQERVFPLRYRVSQPNSDKTDAEGVGRRRLCCAFSSGSIATEFTPTISASLLGQQRFLTEKNCGKSGKV